ncbi:MAG: uncharacterized protein KVP18_000921 [Porospora cf. gigantea A]|uniref:uncharacterized protein n=1 Tax=Porospora cf. gigantea A TaxID=2853593 RepID=UPI0035593EB0|nr:MAG: hypothetical protein KVP18_000921 [Porospora cf. gigantea A]
MERTDQVSMISAGKGKLGVESESKREVQRARNRLSAHKHRQKLKEGMEVLQGQVEEQKKRRIAAEAQVVYLQHQNDDLQQKLEGAKQKTTELEAKIQAWSMLHNFGRERGLDFLPTLQKIVTSEDQIPPGPTAATVDNAITMLQSCVKKEDEN